MITLPTDFDGLYRIPAGLQPSTVAEMLREQDVALLTSLFDADCLQLFNNTQQRPAITLRNGEGGMIMRWRELSVPWIASRANWAIVGMATTKKEQVTNTSATQLMALLNRYRKQLRIASFNWRSVASLVTQNANEVVYRVSNILFLSWCDIGQEIYVLGKPATIVAINNDLVTVTPSIVFNSVLLSNKLKINELW